MQTTKRAELCRLIKGAAQEELTAIWAVLATHPALERMHTAAAEAIAARTLDELNAAVTCLCEAERAAHRAGNTDNAEAFRRAGEFVCDLIIKAAG